MDSDNTLQKRVKYLLLEPLGLVNFGILPCAQQHSWTEANLTNEPTPPYNTSRSRPPFDSAQKQRWIPILPFYLPGGLQFPLFLQNIILQLQV